MRVLALDVGTSSVKAAVLDTDAALPSSTMERVGYELDQPTPEQATIPGERLWSATAAAARAAAKGQLVQGIGISCLTPGLILLDGNQAPLTPVITHLDRRSRALARRTWDEVGPEFLTSVGNRPLPGGISALAFAHLAGVVPGLASQVRHYLHVNGWLALRLCGTAAFDPGNAAFTGLFDTLGRRRWSQRWCGYFGVKPDWLPPVRSGDDTLGGLTAAAAKEFGLPPGIPVKLGVADTSSAMLAADLKPGELLHVVGTTQVLAVHVDRPTPAPDHLTRPLGVGEGFIHVAHNPVGGVALEWLYRLCFRDLSEADFYGRVVPQAAERQTEVVLDPPFLGGDRLEIDARLAAFRELSLASDRMDLLSAVLRAMRECHQRALAALGVARPFSRCVLTGGGAEVVRQLLPEYRACPPDTLVEGSLRGVARLFRPSGAAPPHSGERLPT